MASQAGPSQQPAAAPEITDSGSSSKVVDGDQQIRDDLFVKVMDGDWDAVVDIYTKHKIIVQTSMITKSKETALHIAIMDHKTEAAKKLLELVDANMIKEMKNERENNPLHLAAARGQVSGVGVVKIKKQTSCLCASSRSMRVFCFGFFLTG